MKKKNTYDILTNVSDGFQSRFLAHFSAVGVGDITDENRDQVRPQIVGQFEYCNVLHALSGSRGPVRLGTQGTDDVGLDVVPNILRKGEPSLLIHVSRCIVIG